MARDIPRQGAKALAEHVWTDQEFLALALAQAASGKDPALRLRLLDHALGKPVERVQLERAPIELVGEGWDTDPLPPLPPRSPRPVLQPLERRKVPRGEDRVKTEFDGEVVEVRLDRRESSP